ncbi:hypothetical protein Tco_0117106 [Tanacetum coccineum]
MRNNTVNDGVDVHVTSDTVHLTFFDNQVSQSPNDKMRASSVEDGSGSSSRIDISSQYSEGNTCDNCALSRLCARFCQVAEHQVSMLRGLKLKEARETLGLHIESIFCFSYRACLLDSS